MAAVGGGYLDVVQELLENGADPNAQNGKVLQWALHMDYQEIVEELKNWM